MWILALILLLVAAQLNLTAIVPAAPGQAAPPWWTGGGLMWPFFSDTRTLIPPGEMLNTVTPLLGVGSGSLFLLAAAALLGWVVPSSWFPWLVVAGAVLSIPLQLIWLSGWAVLPLLVDAFLIWAVLGMHWSVTTIRG